MPRVVPIEDVTIREGTEVSSHRRSIEKIKDILDEQGLIEPLLAYRGTLEVGRQVWDAERLIAAREMGWKTVLITDGTY